jgi:integration host factor subunit beta
MVRSELVAKLVDADPHLTKRDVEIIVSIIFREIAAALARGERAGIRGFGNFSIRPRKAWNGRNLHTGTPLSVP